ncbi:MAG TPA: hypothetical protein O0X34_01490 [Methanocorpusculum sp.]|nr:hypothetical protein [Methanocorpusculum sp.]
MQYFSYGTTETNALKEADPILGAAIDRLGHPNRPLMPDIFTALVSSVIAQQISNKAAETVQGRVTDRCGGEVTPDRIAKLTEEEIQSLGMSRRKAGYIRGIALVFVSGQMNPQTLR